MYWIAKIDEKGQKISFDKPMVRVYFAEWAKDNPNERIKIMPYKGISSSARGYFEGAVLPAYALWSENYDHENGDHLAEIRNFLKTKFLSKKFIEPDGSVTVIPDSTTKLTGEEFRNDFLAKCQDYFMENYIPWPDAELYKKWRDEVMSDRPRDESYIDWLNLNGLNVDGSTKD